ncbi:hypothetical protein E3Q10_04131 [Wallemia mellicola]|uniref:ARID domain-containing protein n=1 Tax=Wallemia mellicola TaxID=1708541 RepID=A0A4T0QIF4_9BASI|nr:hypothetical protein E3Q10_04131 [Wallemia mellicola]
MNNEIARLLQQQQFNQLTPQQRQQAIIAGQMNRLQQQQSGLLNQQQQQPQPSAPNNDFNNSPAFQQQIQQAFQSNNLQFLVEAAKSNKLNNENIQRLQKLIRHRQLQQIQLQQQHQQHQQQQQQQQQSQQSQLPQFPNLVPSQIAAAKNLQQKIETIDLQLRNPSLSPQDRDNARKAYEEAKNLQALFIQQLRNSQQKPNPAATTAAPSMVHSQSQPQLGSNYVNENTFSNMMPTNSQSNWPNQQQQAQQSQQPQQPQQPQQQQQQQFPSLSNNINGDNQSNMLGLGLVGASNTPQQQMPASQTPTQPSPQMRPNLSMAAQLQPDNFLKALIELMKKRGTPIEKLPEVDGKGIDLHKLYMTVVHSGGSLEVHRQGKWPLIGAMIGLPLSTQFGESSPRVSNNNAQALANVYREYLAPFEQVWTKALQDQLAQRRAAMMQTQQQQQSQQSPQTRPVTQFPQSTPAPQFPQQATSSAPNKTSTPTQQQQQQQLMASLSTMSDEQLRGLNITPDQILQLRRKIQQPQMSTPVIQPQQMAPTSSIPSAAPMDANILSSASASANAGASASMQANASASEAMQQTLSNNMPTIMMPPKERLAQASQLVQSIKQSIMQQRPPVNSQPNLSPQEQHQIAQVCAEIKPMLISLENILPIFLCLNDPIEPGKIEAVKKISLMTVMYYQQTIMLPQRQFCFNLEDMSRLRIQLARCFMYVKSQVKDVQGIGNIAQGASVTRPASQPPPIPTQSSSQVAPDPTAMLQNALMQQQQQQASQAQSMTGIQRPNDNLKAPPSKRARTSPQIQTQSQPIDLSPSPASQPQQVASQFAQVGATPPKSPYSQRAAALTAARGATGRSRGKPQPRPRNASRGSESNNTPINIDMDSPVTQNQPVMQPTPSQQPPQQQIPQKPTALEDPVAYLENALADFKNNFPASGSTPSTSATPSVSNAEMFNSLGEDSEFKPSLTLEDVHSKPEPEFILSPDDNNEGGELPPNEELDFSLLIDESSFNDVDNGDSGDGPRKVNVETPELINGTNPSPESINEELKSPKDATANGKDVVGKGTNSDTSSTTTQDWFSGRVNNNDQFDNILDNNMSANWLLQDEQLS